MDILWIPRECQKIREGGRNDICSNCSLTQVGVVLADTKEGRREMGVQIELH